MRLRHARQAHGFHARSCQNLWERFECDWREARFDSFAFACAFAGMGCEGVAGDADFVAFFVFGLTDDEAAGFADCNGCLEFFAGIESHQDDAAPAG